MSDATRANVTRPIVPSFANDQEARQTVEARAADLIERTMRQYPDWNPPPFEPERFASALGFPIIRTRAPSDWDALFVPVGERPHIVINTAAGSPRRRSFSIAHEIAHSWFDDPSGATYFLRSQNKERYYRDESAQRLERLCDLGAAELLMPRRWFEAAIAETGRNAVAVPHVAERFCVSREAAALRLVETNDVPCAPGIFEFAAQPSADRRGPNIRAPHAEHRAYRARRVFCSRGFPFLFPPGKSVPENSVIYKATFQRGELQAVEDFSLGRTKARLEVSAFPLHRGETVDAPPAVCAFFTVI